MVLSQKLHKAFKWTVERITGPRTVSAFKEKGDLSVSEFVLAGDNLVAKCPTWSWEAGEPSKRKSYLSADKQYLITRNVPCLRRASLVEEEYAAAGGEFLLNNDDDDNDGWLATHGMPKETKGADEDVLPSMESLEISKAGAIKPISSYFGGEEEEDIPDMEDYDDAENVVETDPATLQSAYLVANEPEDENILRIRTYDISIMYDKYYQTPHVLVPLVLEISTTMLTRWKRAASPLAAALLPPRMRVGGSRKTFIVDRSYSKVDADSASAATAVLGTPSPASSPPGCLPNKPEATVRLNALFWSKPSSLALRPNSALRIEEPHYEGIKRIILKLMLFYSKQSKSIRGANIVYRRIISQVDKPAMYNVFHLEKTFKVTFSLLVLHMWLFLRRLKEEGKEGVDFGQYLYEIYNHDLELRVSKAGVNLLLTKWMKDLEKIFYGNIVAYDAAMTSEAKHNDLAKVLWRNIYSEDGTEISNDAAATASVQAMARYTRRESTCLSLTDKEAIFSGNFTFSSLENKF